MSSERRRRCASRARLGLWLWLVAGAACAPAQADNAAAVVTAQPGVLNLRTGDQDTAALPNLLDATAALQPGRVVAGFGALEEGTLIGPGDVPVTTDYRAVLTPILRQHAPGIDAGAVFPDRSARRPGADSGKARG